MTTTAMRRKQRCVKCSRTSTEVHRLHYLGGTPTGCNHEWSDDAVVPPRRAGAGEHTPTPWHVSNLSFGGAESDGDLVIRSRQGIVAYACTSNEGLINAQNNARHIAHCVNSHATLIAALEAALNFFKPQKGGPSVKAEQLRTQLEEALQKVRE